MSHFGRSGPPDIVDTYSLLVLNISFRTTADDLFPYFDKYGKVVDVFIPKDRRIQLSVFWTGESRGFAFVRYKYQDEAQKAVDRLDGRVVDGREIMVQFAKYGPNAERIHKGGIIERLPRSSGRSRSHSPRRRRRSRSRSWDRYDRDRYHRGDRDYSHRSRSRTASPDYDRGHVRGRDDNDRRWSRSQLVESASPPRYSLSLWRSLSPQRTPASRGESLDRRGYDERSPTPRRVSPTHQASNSQGPSPRNLDIDE